MEYSRNLRLEELLQKKSYFFFGPWFTSKTTLIKNTLPTENYPLINLLRVETRLTLLKNPSDLRRMIPDNSNIKAIVIDEIQKIPELLDEVHDLIEDKGIKILLIGCSAQNIKRCGVNCLSHSSFLEQLWPPPGGKFL